MPDRSVRRGAGRSVPACGDWQKQFIRDIYEPHDRATGRRLVRRAILSIARKNGKTALIAALVLAHLVGPEAIQNGEIYSAANDREQAAQVFKMARQMVEADPELAAMIKVVPSTKTHRLLSQRLVLPRHLGRGRHQARLQSDLRDLRRARPGEEPRAL